MMPAIMLYTLAATAMASALSLAILNAIAYATLQSLPSPTPGSGLAPLSLSVISWMALTVLGLLLHKDVRGEHQWSKWKTGVFYFTGAYLLIAAASSSATMTTAGLPSGLWISRSIVWAVSVLSQGLYFGFLLATTTQKKPEPARPRSYPRELKSIPDSPSSIAPPAAIHDPYTRGAFDTNKSSLRKFPRRSRRYPGGALSLENPSEAKYNSFDTSSSTSSSPEPSPTKDQLSNAFAGQDTRPLLRGNGSIRSMPSLRQQRVQHSLDSLVERSPTASLDSSSASTLTLADTREHNIHPLFRSTSPSPPPTPTRGTMVRASPSAGQTITKSTLTRMKSARSLRTPSPLPGSEEGAPGLALVHGGQIRRSRSTTQYGQRYELSESPDER